MSVRIPKMIVSSGMKTTVKKVIRAPQAKTVRPRFSGCLPSGQQIPESRMKVQQMLFCHASAPAESNHGHGTPKVRTRSHVA
ncbi:MAG: hypothetical protein LKM41_07585 [Lachnospiraceae bacterium]|nr:hypothetical protein [Lachnospiraceae bacterium]